MIPPPRVRAAEAVAVTLLLAVTALVCLPAIDGPFTFDETAGIADNRALRPGAPPAAALAYRFSPDQARPLFFLSLWIDARLGGTAPRPFRITNIALHLLCGILVYLWIRRLVRRVGPALAGCALFLLHPLQAESALYTWGRSGVLSVIFLLTSLLLVPLPGAAGPPARRAAIGWAAAVLALALALAAKEEAIVAPLIGLVAWRLVERRPWPSVLRGAAALALPVACFLALRSACVGSIGRQVYVRSVADTILGQGPVTLRMLRLFFVPAGFSVDHAAGVPSIVKGALAMLLCAAIIVTAFRLAGRPATAAIGAGILVAAAACTIYWAVPLPDLMSERRAYLPMIGAALAFAAAVGPFLDRPGASSAAGRAAAAFLPAAVVAALLAPLLLARARLWGDPRLLWEEAARLGPSLVRPLINLGVMAAERGDSWTAADLFDRAVALEPRNAEALFNRARLRLDTGRDNEALADLETAVSAAPAMPRAWINLGIVRIRRNDLPGAEEALRAALAIDPGDPRALTNLAEVLRATDRAVEALPLYRQALVADPAYAHAAVRLGVALEALGDRAGALAAYREYLRRGPPSKADRDTVLKKIDALQAGGPAR